jgi:hypothetical protein
VASLYSAGATKRVPLVYDHDMSGGYYATPRNDAQLAFCIFLLSQNVDFRYDIYLGYSNGSKMNLVFVIQLL